jgi:hypothetical protein
MRFQAIALTEKMHGVWLRKRIPLIFLAGSAAI